MEKFVIKATKPSTGSRAQKLHVVGPLSEAYSEALEKAAKLVDEDGILTSTGQAVAAQYAKKWVKGTRDIAMEREFPDLQDLFYDIRVDSTLARRHAS